ncbi:helix-turn-helix domain-containing protein [Rhodoblastus acidophilus]|uniref:Helix-turn-helix domain-containing protein n=1 Tax=Candidatus Rhodoblastus alkanivorans TaxID=2954117 RepID=A0ABS9Z706_9HYPH|nr:helix-turn-helix transcriptional regulator [Candidatus Rhodoblastus alkanivorans]MCI4680427.1 helix-turn-helix domain-containing protein [Candidatus Rhodoblastus alkanivorans]MCI4683210.1 helix-turn-helix domain-containing protein [Candidatus Rhodoblastus alkanivorans]MDI4640522.1 helix-turn-helix domain-containing protein [Rhodoblastus acidophilus]
MASDYDDARLAEALRAVIKKKRVSMKLISEKLGISYRTVQNYINGENRIPADFFLRLAHLLRIDADYFIYGDFRPHHSDLYDAVCGSLIELGLMPSLGPETPQHEREKALTLAARMTADLEARYDRFRAEGAFGPFVSHLSFGRRETKTG